MNKFWEKVEHCNAKLITPAVVVLLFVIIVELFFQDFAHHYHTPILIVDGLVIAVFVIDLIFLAIKAKSTAFFFKSYWLDLLAVFPFGIFVNVMSRVYTVFAKAGGLGVGQAILHEGLEARKGVKGLKGISKVGIFAKWIRIGARLIRVVTKSRLFSHYHSKHHMAKRNIKAGKNPRKAEKLKAKKAKLRAKKKAKKSKK